MKHFLFLILLSFRFFSFSQEILTKTIPLNTNTIEVLTDGIDELKIYNTDSEQLTIKLFDENPNTHHILIDETTSILKIGFKLEFLKLNSVFRKFITQRLNRVNVIIYVPKNKSVTLLGTNIDILSNSYKGNLNIYIDKGLIKLGTVQNNTAIKLFQGNVYATLFDSNINIKTRNGKLIIDNKQYQQKFKNQNIAFLKSFELSSINANVFLDVKRL